MDARQRSTLSRLDEAILDLASHAPIDDVSVADIARRARISRDTFYRWFASPVDLLADTLGRRLDDVIDTTPLAPGAPGRSDLDPLTEALLRFISENAAIYRGASRPRLDATLRDGLLLRIERALTEWIERNPGALPSIDGQDPDELARAVFVAYAAHGVVGAYEVWLARGDLDDIDGIEARIYASAAPWWSRNRV